MEDILLTTIHDTMDNFDLSFCIAVNVATYIVIKIITDYKKKTKVSTWNKRLVLLAVGLVVATVYYFTGSDVKTIFNSFIIAPISWSWILKPVCDKLDIGYNAKVK